MVQKILYPPGFKTGTIHTTVGHYTTYIILAVLTFRYMWYNSLQHNYKLFLCSIRHHNMKYGGVEVQLLILLTLSLDGQWLASHSTGKEPPLPMG